MFKRALIKAVRDNAPRHYRRILWQLNNPLAIRNGRVLPMHGSQLVYAQCCAEMVSENEHVGSIMDTFETIYQWLIDNWEKVLGFLMSLLLFI